MHTATAAALLAGAKPCKGCGETLAFDQYPPEKSVVTGLSARCWSCTRLRRRSYYAKDRVAEIARRKARADAKREQLRAYARQHYQRNREARIRVQYEYKARRRAREVGADCGCVTNSALSELADALGSACSYCGGPFEHWDHAVPLALGGLHCLDNLVTACAKCNLSKGRKTQEAFLAS